jgi:hypothetical protein
MRSSSKYGVDRNSHHFPALPSPRRSASRSSEAKPLKRPSKRARHQRPAQAVTARRKRSVWVMVKSGKAVWRRARSAPQAKSFGNRHAEGINRTVKLEAELQHARLNGPSRIEGYAIVSENGMIATAKGAMPRALKFDADQEFFERALNGVDVVVHGRHSRERHRRSDLRRRLVLNRDTVERMRRDLDTVFAALAQHQTSRSRC